VSKEGDFSRLLQIEEEYIENMCADIIALKPDVVVTEKGVSDLAQHYFVKVPCVTGGCVRHTAHT
jgi:T-complex protein 1 subunit gamma